LSIAYVAVALSVTAAALAAAWLVARAETRRKGDRVESLARLTQAVSLTLSLDDVSRQVADATARLVPGSSVRVFVLEHDELLVRAEAGSGGIVGAPHTRLRLGEGLVGHAATLREPLVVEDLPAHPRTLDPEWMRAHDCRSGALLPLLGREGVCGVLGVYTGERHRFTGEEIDLLSAFASQVAIAIDNARLYERAAGRLRRVESLRAIERRVAEQFDPEALLAQITRDATELLAAMSASVYVVHDDQLVAGGWYRMGDWLRETPLPLDSGLTGEILARKRGMIINDYPASPWAREPFKSINSRVIAQPLLAGERAIGVLFVNRSADQPPFVADDLALVGDFATQAAVALEHSRLYADASLRAARMRTLAETARLLVATLEPAQIVEIITARCLEGLEVNDVAVYLVDDDLGHLRLLRREPAGTPSVHITRLERDEGMAGRAVTEQRPVWTRDALRDPSVKYLPESRARLAERGSRALLAVPLGREETIGAVLVGRPPGALFTPDEIEFLSTLTRQAAVALENARLFSLEQRRRAQIEALVEIERELAAELHTERLLDLIIERASELLRAEGIIFFLEDERTLVPRAWYGLGPWLRDVRVPLGQGVAGTCALERRGMIVNEYRAWPNALPVYWQYGIERTMGQPLIARDRLLGVISVNRGPGSEPFTQVDLATFESFAIQAAIALENARLYRAARRHAEHLEALDVVNRQVASSLQFEEVLRNIANATLRFLDAAYVAVWVADPGARVVRRSVVVGDEELASRLPSELAFGEGGAGWVAEYRTPILWTDLQDDRRVVGGGLALRHGLRFYTAVPVMLGDRLLGVISVRRPTPPEVTPETESLIKSLAAQAAIALEHARLYAETTTRLHETSALLEVSRILNSTLESRRLLKQVAMKIAQVCRVERCTIELWEAGRTIPVMSQFADGHREPAMWEAFVGQPPRDPALVPAHAQAITTRAPVVIDDTAQSDLIPPDWIETFRLRSCVFVPLIRQDKVIGVMNLDYCERVRAFEPSQVRLAMAIAGQLALAMDNTRLYAEAQERLRETTTLLAVGQALSQPGPVDEVLRRVAREVGLAFGADTVGAYMLDARREALVPVAGWHVPKELWHVFVSTPLEIARFPALFDDWQHGQPFWSPDMKRDPRVDPAPFLALPPMSAMFVPTRVRGEGAGALFLVWWETGRAFPPAEIRLLEGVGAQVGLAMENAELTLQTQEKLKETELLLEVSRSLTSTLDLPALLRQFLRRVQRVLGSDSVGVWLCEDASPWMRAVVGYRVPPDRLDAFRQVRLSSVEHAFYAEAFRSKRPVYSSEVGDDPRMPRELLDDLTWHRSELFVPIVARDVVIGGFIAVWWTERREFAAGELALMEAVAGQAGAAIENARLFSDNRRRLEELSLLYELSQAVTGQLDRDALAATIYRQLARVLDAPTAGILGYDETREEFEVVLGIKDGAPEEEQAGRRLPLGEGLISRAAVLRQPIRVDDYAEACRRAGVTPVDVGLRHRYWLGAPMVAGDEVVGVIVVCSSARAFTEADERLLSNIAGLAGLAFRSARLYEDRLRAYSELVAAQDHLVRADKLRALGEMASGVAHDFNNLLTSIVGRAQMLLERVQEPRFRQWLQVIERAALDGARTVRRLQEFTRIRRDQSFVSVDLNEVVREAIEVTQFRWKDDAVSHGLELVVATALAPLPSLSGDPAELREALTNLILNAVDAMPSGGTLTLGTRLDGDVVGLTVADTGEGMTDEVKRRLFEPFFTTKGPKGTGLGLSMTFGIVSRHGGQIEVESEPGKGTQFHLRFPVPASPLTDLPAPAPRGVAAETEPARCLVVDDEELVREMLGDVLAHGGHSVVLAGGGSEAIERFKAEPFDLVLTDLGMPGVTGWQVARACKDARPDVPVLLVTGWGVELSSEELATHGVDAVLSKPLKVDQVLNAVASLRRKHA
jgi:GAF domain-containing protein/CheY-like chemotaxis protein